MVTVTAGRCSVLKIMLASKRGHATVLFLVVCPYFYYAQWVHTNLSHNTIVAWAWPITWTIIDWRYPINAFKELNFRLIRLIYELFCQSIKSINSNVSIMMEHVCKDWAWKREKQSSNKRSCPIQQTQTATLSLIAKEKPNTKVPTKQWSTSNFTQPKKKLSIHGTVNVQQPFYKPLQMKICIVQYAPGMMVDDSWRGSLLLVDIPPWQFFGRGCIIVALFRYSRLWMWLIFSAVFMSNRRDQLSLLLLTIALL